MSDQLARGIWTGFGAGDKPFQDPNAMPDNLRLIDDHLALYTLQAPVAPDTALPASPADGDGQIFTDGTYAVFNAGTWVIYPARSGVRACLVDGSNSWRCSGTGWVSFSDALAGSYGASLVGSAAWYADTISGFNATAVPDGATVVFSGRDVTNDGGGGVFAYSAGSSQTVDDVLVFAPTGGGRLFREGWTVFGFSGKIDARWSGVKADWDGATGTDDADAIQRALNCVPDPSSGYYGGGEVVMPGAKCLIGRTIYYPKNNITFSGVNSLSSVLVAKTGFVGTEMLRIDPADHPTYVIFRNCNVRDIGFDHNNVAGILSIRAKSLNDGCEFKSLRSWNFDGTVFRLGKSGRAGALLSQGVKIDSWDAITSTDVVADIFITDECNEVLFINNKAVGLSSGTSTKVGFHIGVAGLSQGVTLIGNSAAHIVNGTGIRFNYAQRCWAHFNTLENVKYDIWIGHETTAANCLFIEAHQNRYYPTPTNPPTNVTIDYAQSCCASLRENGTINITANALNCEAKIATNRTDGTSLPSTVTLASTSSVVHETHKNGTATHHANGSLSVTATSSGIFDIKLPGGGFVRGDSTRASLIGATGKGVRITSNSSSVEIDSSGRVLISGLGTVVPAVSNALYKDASNFVKIT